MAKREVPRERNVDMKSVQVSVGKTVIRMKKRGVDIRTT